MRLPLYLYEALDGWEVVSLHSDVFIDREANSVMGEPAKDDETSVDRRTDL